MGDGRSLESLWKRRSHAFRKETTPYFRYMSMSGFPAFLSLIAISGTLGYFKLIRDLPPHFPITAVGVIALVLASCWTPLRTWLAPADTVFLMPREGEMGSYIAASYRRSTIMTALFSAVMLLLYVPIYRQGAAPAHWLVLILGVAAIRGANLWGGWKERKIAWPGMRRLLRTARWLATVIVLYAWLTFVPWQSAIFTLLVAALFAIVYRLPSSHRFPWERLIEEEKTTHKRYYTFFGMFIDVPTLPSPIARRSYIAWVLRLVPYSRRNTFVYLYLASLLRTEMGGILIRLLLLGGLVTYWIAEDASLSGWGASLVYALFLLVLSVQLGALRQVHRHSVWKHVYPLPDSQRIQHYTKVDRMALIVVAAWLALPLALPLLMQGYYTPVVATAACVLAYIAIRPSRIRKKLRKEEDDD
ncbi:ABC transporter permease [Paenibacillus harenae]|uniref:ABC transporter permease n=1 Tax=Paenibacillus harenae TaxID=306543 RepID=UPI00278DA42C|nr:ABC transporter permease [Paenibacillus harenae]MDQ0061172.1 ABC-2 type transport system permease protein [Paenibacillus harenae]